jgi:hypothetical protein
VEVGQIVDAKPDAIFIVAFDGVAALCVLLKRGDARRDEDLRHRRHRLRDLGAASIQNPTPIEGLKGVAPARATTVVLEPPASNPDLKVTNFSPYFYDCVITTRWLACAARERLSASLRRRS